MAIAQRRRSSPVGQAMSLEAFLELPERKPYIEYDDGVVTQKMSPKGEHSTLESAFTELVNRMCSPDKVARAFTELRVTFGGKSTVPDVSVYRWERIERKPNGEVGTDFTTPPDVAIEILSFRQSVPKLIAKCDWYVANGVRVSLLVDEKKRIVLAIRPDRAMLSLSGDDAIDLADILPGFALTVRQLFDTLRLD